MSGALSDLVVDLKLNSAALKAGLDDAKSAFASFGEQLEGIDKKLHSLSQSEGFKIGKEVIEGIAEFVQKGAEAAAQMGILAHAAGIPVESFSKLSYAANLSGVSTEELSAGLNKLNKNIGLAGAGVPQQVALFSALGVAVKDSNGNVKNGSVVMAELATKFAGLEDGASKAALEMEVFGKTGTGFDQMLSLGADGLGKLGDRAARFGLVTGPDAAEAAHAFERNLKDLELAGEAVGRRVAVDLAPAFTDLTNKLLDSKTGSDGLSGATKVLEAGLRVVASTAVIVAAAFDGAGTWIGLTAAKIAALAHGDLKNVARANDELAASLKATGDRMKEQLSTIWDGPSAEAQKESEKTGAAAKASADKVQAAFEQQKKAITDSDTAMKGLRETLEQWNTKAAESGKSPLAALEAQLNSGKLADQLHKIGDRADAMRWSLEQAGKAIIVLAAMKLDDKISFEVARTGASTAASVDQKARDFSNIGKPIDEQNLTRGFSSFEDALAAYAQQTDEAARLSGSAERAKANNELDFSDQLTLMADGSKRAADQALLAAGAFSAAKLRLIAADKVEFGVGRADAGTLNTVAQRTRDFNNIGASPEALRIQQEGGFKSFDDALSAFAIQSRAHAEAVGAAEALQSQGNTASAEAMLEFADQAKLLADRASTAADAFKAAAEDGAAKVAAALVSAGASITSKMGDIGQLINAGVQGFQSGGIWGALIAVIMEIVSRMKSFMTVLDYFNSNMGEHIDRLSKVFAPIFNALQSFSETMDTLSNAFPPIQWAFTALKGVLFVFGKAVEGIEIVFLSIAKAFADLGGGDKGINAQLKKVQDEFATPFVDDIGPLVALGDAATKTAAAFSQLNTNIPTGYKLGAANFASDMGIGGGLADSGPAAPLGTKDDPIYTSDAGTGLGALTWDPVTGIGTSTSDTNGTNSYNPTTGQTKNQGDLGVNDEQTRNPNAGKAGYNSYGNAIAPPDATYWAAFQMALAQGYDVQTAMAIAAQAQAMERGSSTGAATAAGSGVRNIGSAGGGIQSVGGGGGDTHIHVNGPIYPRNFSDFVKTITDQQKQHAGQRKQNPTHAARP